MNVKTRFLTPADDHVLSNFDMEMSGKACRSLLSKKYIVAIGVFDKDGMIGYLLAEKGIGEYTITNVKTSLHYPASQVERALIESFLGEINPKLCKSVAFIVNEIDLELQIMLREMDFRAVDVELPDGTRAFVQKGKFGARDGYRFEYSFGGRK